METSGFKRFIGPAFDAIFIVVLASISVLIFQTRNEVENHRMQLWAVLSEGELRDQAVSRTSFFSFSSLPKKNSSNALTESAKSRTDLFNKFQSSVNDLQLLSIGCIIAATLMLVSYKTKDYFLFRRPQRALANRIRKISSGNLAPAEGAPLKTLVEQLISSREESKLFITEIANGNLDFQPNFTQHDSFTESLLSMQQKLQLISSEEKKSVWINKNLSDFDSILKIHSGAEDLYTRLISFLSQKTESSVGTLYQFIDTDVHDSHFVLIGSYGFYNNLKTPKRIPFGEGQLGEIARTKQTVCINNIPSAYLSIHSALGSAPATHVVMVPLIFKEKIYGAIELASFHAIDEYQVRWLERAGESLAAFFFNQKVNADAQAKLEQLSKKQADELVEIHALQRETNNRLQSKLEEAEAMRIKNEAILNGCVDGVVSFDENGVVVFANNTFREILGVNNNTVLSGTSISALMPVVIEDSSVFYTSGATSKTIGVRTEASVTISSGEVIDVLITCSVVSIGNESVFTFFVQKISVDLF